MADTCSTCKFWEHWRVVLLADDEPKALGHCVVKRHLGENIVQTIIQGLTGEDFYCDRHAPASNLNTGESDGTGAG